MSELQPATIGRTVHYTLSEEDAAAINRRRTNPGSIAKRISEALWPIGAQAHIGNEARAGQVLPAVVVAVWGPRCVNLQVTLDGTDTYWATSRDVSTTGEPAPACWHWPARG